MACTCAYEYKTENVVLLRVSSQILSFPASFNSTVDAPMPILSAGIADPVLLSLFSHLCLEVNENLLNILSGIEVNDAQRSKLLRLIQTTAVAPMPILHTGIDGDIESGNAVESNYTPDGECY
jgi:hypothetical protein